MIQLLQRYNFTILKSWLLRVVILFVLLFIFSFSFPHYYIIDIGKWFSPFFEILAQWSAKHIFKISSPNALVFVSDSLGFYINAFNILVISIIIGTVWTILSHSKNNPKLLYLLFVVIRYYLAIQMLVYGWSKVFKWQFYLPEPNLLFTPLGQLSHDILYWSTMGMSRSYVMFAGILEILIAILLFFRRTQLLAALIGIGVMSNVVAINFGFNISVKLYSSFLLFLFILLAIPDLPRLFAFFIQNKNTLASRLWSPNFQKTSVIRWYRILKTLVVGIILIDSLAMYIQANNFNDDNHPRPKYHGAFQVQSIIQNSETIPLSLDSTQQWKRIFIHRKGFLISQNRRNVFQDYQIEEIEEGKFEVLHTETKAKQILTIHHQNDTLIFNFVSVSDSIQYLTLPIDLEALPLMQREFNWYY